MYTDRFNSETYIKYTFVEFVLIIRSSPDPSSPNISAPGKISGYDVVTVAGLITAFPMLVDDATLTIVKSVEVSVLDDWLHTVG